MARIPRAAVYVRRSSNANSESSLSPQLQRGSCVQYVTDHGWKFDPAVDVYQDLGRSAWRTGTKREGFERLLANAKSGRYERIVVYRMDRLSRDWQTWGEVLGALPKNFEIHSATEAVNSVANKFAVQILAAVAEESSDATRKRVGGAKKARIEQGAWVGSIRPFGWEPVIKDGRRTLVLVKREAKALRHVIDMVLKGDSVMNGSRWLSEHGFATTMPPKKNEDGTYQPKTMWWSATALNRLLRNPVLVGCRGHRPARGSQSPEIKFVDGKPHVVFEPLIDWATWDRLQLRLARQSERKTNLASSLLAGIVRCEACGYAMSTGGAKSGHSAVYRCKSRYDRGPESCPGCSISRPRLDEHVSLLGLLLLAGSDSRTGGDPTDERIAQLQIAMDQIVGDLYDPIQMQDRTEELKARLWRQLDKHEKEMRQLKSVSQRRAAPAPLPRAMNRDIREALLAAGTDSARLADLVALDSWTRLGVPQRREMIASVIEAIVVTKGDRAATARMPNELRGNVGPRLSVVLTRNPETTVAFDVALSEAVAAVALRLVGAD
jgi:DNA invertase Pin-like site-specific DNA recombinase